jgi:hypothetical protein
MSNRIAEDGRYSKHARSNVSHVKYTLGMGIYVGARDSQKCSVL